VRHLDAFKELAADEDLDGRAGLAAGGEDVGHMRVPERALRLGGGRGGQYGRQGEKHLRPE